MIIVGDRSLALGGVGDEDALETVSPLADHLDDADGLRDPTEGHGSGDIGEVVDDAVGQALRRADVGQLHPEFVIHRCP